MRVRRRLKVGVASVLTAAGGVLAAAGPAEPAVAFFSPPLFLDVAIESPATLVARGAAVDVVVDVTCTGRTAIVTVSVTQAGRGRVAQGVESVEVGCSRSRERVALTVPASGDAFRRGSAFVQARVSGCDADFTVCGAESNQATVRVR